MRSQAVIMGNPSDWVEWCQFLIKQYFYCIWLFSFKEYVQRCKLFWAAAISCNALGFHKKVNKLTLWSKFCKIVHKRVCDEVALFCKRVENLKTVTEKNSASTIFWASPQFDRNCTMRTICTPEHVEIRSKVDTVFNRTLKSCQELSQERSQELISSHIRHLTFTGKSDPLSTISTDLSLVRAFDLNRVSTVSPYLYRWLDCVHVLSWRHTSTSPLATKGTAHGVVIKRKAKARQWWASLVKAQARSDRNLIKSLFIVLNGVTAEKGVAGGGRVRRKHGGKTHFPGPKLLSPLG